MHDGAKIRRKKERKQHGNDISSSHHSVSVVYHRLTRVPARATVYCCNVDWWPKGGQPSQPAIQPAATDSCLAWKKVKTRFLFSENEIKHCTDWHKGERLRGQASERERTGYPNGTYWGVTDFSGVLSSWEIPTGERTMNSGFFWVGCINKAALEVRISYTSFRMKRYRQFCCFRGRISNTDFYQWKNKCQFGNLDATKSEIKKKF